MNDEAKQREMGIGTTKTRRNLLAAAGGLVLAASGLVRPAWIEETDAREGSFGGRLGGRHGKNRRGRDKKRNKNRNKNRNNGGSNGGNNNNKKGTQPPPGSTYVAANVRLIVENLTANDIDFVGRSVYEEQAGKVCRVQALQTIHPNEAPTYQSNNWNAFADLNGRYAIGAAQAYPDDFPGAEASLFDGTLNANGCPANGTVTLPHHLMGVGQKVNVTMEGHQFEILRENDIGNERVFRIKVHS